MKTVAMQDIEGLWQFPVNGTVIAIERDDEEATRFRIVAVEAPYLVIANGLLLGYAYPTVKDNVFEASLTAINNNGTPKDRKNKQESFILTLNDNNGIAFKPVKKGWTIKWDWWRLFPYMFRFRVDKIDDKPKGLEGAVRIWPRSLTVPPRQPRYL